MTKGLIPALRGHLNRIPRTGKRWRITQVEVVQLLDLHPMVERSGEHINSLGNFGGFVSDHLRSQQAASATIASDPHMDTVSSGIINFVIP